MSLLSPIFLINAHEHFESAAEVPRYLEIMGKTGLTHSVLVGSHNYTLFLNPEMGFERYHENNLEILEIQKQHPDRFSAFVTLNPLDSDNSERLEKYIAQGARGLKLYYGLGGSHGKGPFHSVPLDYEKMNPVFERCEELGFPIIFHVNGVKFYDELLRFLGRHPTLKVLFPHFMVSLKTPQRLQKVARLLSRYPNIYTDCSYGREHHLLSIAAHMTKRNAEFRSFFQRWSTRILFGTDLVITRVKLEQWGDYVEEMIRWYRAIIETRGYAVRFRNARYVFRGLHLAPEILDHIYYKNFLSFVTSKVYTPREALKLRNLVP